MRTISAGLLASIAVLLLVPELAPPALDAVWAAGTRSAALMLGALSTAATAAAALATNPDRLLGVGVPAAALLVLGLLTALARLLVWPATVAHAAHESDDRPRATVTPLRGHRAAGTAASARRAA